MPPLPEIFLCLIINSLACVGFYLATDYELDEHGKPVSGQLLWRLKYYGVKWFGEYSMKPVCGCLWCMASLHSLYIYIPAFGLNWFLAIYILSLSGLNAIVSRIVPD